MNIIKEFYNNAVKHVEYRRHGFMDKFLYNQYTSAHAVEQEDKNKAKAFLERVEPFTTVHTIAEARELAKKILPTKENISYFNVGNLKVTVVNRDDMFRLSIDSPEEFICYDFSTK